MLGGLQVTSRAQDHAREMLDAGAATTTLKTLPFKGKRAKPRG
jgi:hypothetical protein